MSETSSKGTAGMLPDQLFYFDGDTPIAVDSADDFLLLPDFKQQATWFDGHSLGSVDGMCWLGVYFSEERGWLLNSCGRSDRAEFFSCNDQNNLGQEIVIRKAGQPERFRDGYFVNRNIMELAVRYFFATQERCPDVKWVRIGTGGAL